jgi:deoxyhypusine synthase
MTTATHMHRPSKATARYSEGVSWLTIEDDEGNSVAIFADYRTAAAMADAFNDAQEKLRTYSREELIAEGV